MTKADIVSEIAKSTGVEKVQVQAIVEAFMDSIKTSLTNKNNVYLRGFGSFIVSGSSALVIVGRIMFMVAVAFSFCSMGVSFRFMVVTFRFMVVFIVVVCDGTMAMSFMTLCILVIAGS